MKKDEKNVFLNTLGQMSRDMYQVDTSLHKDQKTQKKEAPESFPMKSRDMNKERFSADMILNTGVKDKNQTSDDARLIANLTEEIKSLKGKMSFVIEKDEEIYRLQCEKKLSDKKYAELQGATVTDESLVRDNDMLKSQNETLQKETDRLSEENISLKKKLVSLHHQLKTARSTSMHTSSVTMKPEGYILNIGAIKDKLSSQNIKNVDSVLLSVILKYKLSDNQWITADMMSQIMEEIISGCKLSTEDV